MTEQGGEALWTPLSVVDSTMYQPGVGSVQAKQVAYRLFDGTISSINIPNTEYNAKVVQERIHAAAVHHQQVMALKGPPVGSDPNVPLAPLPSV